MGAGHGLAGALITFTNFPALIKNEDDFRILQNIGDHLLSLQTSEGHFPVLMQPSPRFQFQPFVQFCHGAPGIGLALCRMYQLTKNNKYLEASIRAADVVWNYGLLQKGLSIFACGPLQLSFSKNFRKRTLSWCCRKCVLVFVFIPRYG